jgi:hypothetical protein
MTKTPGRTVTGAQSRITRQNQEIAINERVIEELLYEDPSEEGEDEEKHYTDSVEDAEPLMT